MFDFSSFNLGGALKALTPRITIGFACAAAILLYLHETNRVTVSTAVFVSALVVFLLCGCLAVTSLVAAAWSATKGLREGVARSFSTRREKRRIESELSFLAPGERTILSHLLANNQRVFEVLPDGEEAATLITKGLVVYPKRRPLAFHRDIVVEIPPHVWEVLVRHKNEFPHQNQESVADPWRTHWMAR
jgi:hypothetical protein